MQNKTIVSISLLLVVLALPAWAKPLVEAPPPPPMPEEVPPSQGEAPQNPVTIETPSRGQLLYENQCIACHESMVHIRTHRQVKSSPELRAQVVRWAAYANPTWGDEEVEEVVRYLDTQYYRFEK
jgi:mono/diheme cytochrome c family protein